MGSPRTDRYYGRADCNGFLLHRNVLDVDGAAADGDETSGARAKPARIIETQQQSSYNTLRARAVACARRIFYRPDSVVDALIAAFGSLSEEQYPGHAAVVRTAYERPIRMGATREVFALRALHWPMLNLLDRADRERRAFADAIAATVTAAREAARARGALE